MRKLIDELEEFMASNGQYYSQFYVGISNSPEYRLANGHSVTVDIPHRFSTVPMRSEVVREVEKYFLAKGCKGGPGGGDSSATYIYVYYITPSTRQ